MPSFATPREQRIFDRLATQAETNLATLRGEMGAQLRDVFLRRQDRRHECRAFSLYHRHMAMQLVHRLIDETNPAQRTVLLWEMQRHHRQAVYWREAAKT